MVQNGKTIVFEASCSAFGVVRAFSSDADRNSILKVFHVPIFHFCLKTTFFEFRNMVKKWLEMV